MEFVSALFQGPLLVFTIPMLIAVLFWLLPILGLFDFDALDLDVDATADLDVDADLDAHADLHGGTGLLQLLGLGMIPLSLTLTLLLFAFGWTGIALHGFLGPSLGWSSLGLNLLFVPLALFAALFAAAGGARLLRPLFREYEAPTTAFDLVGKIASLNSSTVSPTFGSAVVKVEGDRIEIAARCTPEANRLRYGDRVLIIDYDPANNIYQIAPYEDDLEE